MDKLQFNPKAVDTSQTNKKVDTPVSTDRLSFNPNAERERIKQEAASEISLWTKPLGALPTWSFSALLEFESCPYRSYLKRVEGAKEPSGPAADRGSQLHAYAEDYIQGKIDTLPADIKHKRGIIEALRDDYAKGIVEVEGDWGFTRDWKTTGWTDDNVWARIKLDAIKHESTTSAVIYDWKSGKKFGNELKHATQLMTYAIGTFERYPKVDFVYGAMVYIDKDELLEGTYTRREYGQFKKSIEKRALIMTTATEFPPKPSQHNCRWCKLKAPLEGETEARCKWGVL